MPRRSSPAPRHSPHLREITDARTLRALSHPVRLALIEELTIGGAMTATELGERIGESPTTCSSTCASWPSTGSSRRRAAARAGPARGG